MTSLHEDNLRLQQCLEALERKIHSYERLLDDLSTNKAKNCQRIGELTRRVIGFSEQSERLRHAYKAVVSDQLDTLFGVVPPDMLSNVDKFNIALAALGR